MRNKYKLLIALSILLIIDYGMLYSQNMAISSAAISIIQDRNELQNARQVENKRYPDLSNVLDSVNIAYGKISEVDIVNATDAIIPEQMIKYDNSQNLTSFLTRKISSTSGILNLRGLGNALVLIDGVPRSISSITTDEVEQVTFLRDANATALYGTRGKNGVILITTKRGDNQGRKINFTIDKGFSDPIVMPKYLGSADYMRLRNEALANDGQDAAFSDELISNYASGSNPYRYPNVDYYSSEFLNNTRPFTRAGFEFSGGNNVAQYYTNFGWNNTGSLYKLSDGENWGSNRLHMRANVQMRINDFIKASIDGFVLFDIDKQPNGDFWSSAATMHPYYYSPLLPISMINGNENLLETAKLINGSYILGGTSQYTDNVYGNMLLSGYNQNTDRTVTFNTGIEFDLRKILDGLKLNTNVSIDIFNNFQQSVNNLYAVYQPTWETIDGEDKITGLTTIGQDQSTGTLNLNTADYYRSTSFFASLDYKKQFSGVHNFSSTLLGYYARTKTNFSIFDAKPAHIGLRLAYDYDKKYFVDLSNAYVYSVKLAKGNRGAISPTIGLAWMMSEEDWFKTDFLNQFKIKASAGITNTDVDFGYNLYRSILGGAGYYNYADGSGSTMTLMITREENKNLTFEKIKSLNLGVEGKMLNNSLTVAANLFYMENSGQVTQRTTFPAFFSSNTPYLNYNSDSYSGLELGIDWLKKVNDFTFNINGNILFASTNIKVRDEMWQEDYLYRQGRPVSAMFGLESLGFFKDQADIDNSPVQEFGEVRPGDIKYKDQNNDGKINANDNIFLGDWRENLTYGINLLLEYKNVALFVGIHGINGGTAMYNSGYFWNDGFDKYSEIVLDRWTPETANTATYPRLTSGTSSNNFRNSSFWMYDRSYLNLDRVQLTYQLPYKVISKIMAKEMSIYLRGSNLLMIAEDADKQQIVVGQQPQYRNFALGLRVMF